MKCTDCRLDERLHAAIESALGDVAPTHDERVELVRTALDVPVPLRRRPGRFILPAVAAAALLAGLLAWFGTGPTPPPAPVVTGDVDHQRTENLLALRLPAVEAQVAAAPANHFVVVAGGELIGISANLDELLKAAEKKTPKAQHRFVFRAGTQGRVHYETLFRRGPMVGMKFLTAADLKFWEKPSAGQGVFRLKGGRLTMTVSVGDAGPGEPGTTFDAEVVSGFTGPLLLPDPLTFARFEIPGTAILSHGEKLVPYRRYLVSAGFRSQVYHVEAIGNPGTVRPEPVPFEWVRIPAGTVRIGEPGATQAVELDAFEIMKHEVTNRQWWDYLRSEEERLKAVGRFRSSVPRHWNWKPSESGFPLVPPGREAHPVVHVTWHAAHDFCSVYLPRRLTCREAYLPSGAQWEMAARGTADERRYPWGDDPRGQRARVREMRCNVLDTGLRGPTDVGGFFRDVSPFGVLGLAGNVSEFVGMVDRNYMAYKGGSFEDPLVDAQVHFETVIPAGSRFTWSYIGFRAARP